MSSINENQKKNSEIKYLLNLVCDIFKLTSLNM